MVLKKIPKITPKEKKVYLVGTIHVSKKTAKKVEDTIATVLPDIVCVELDLQRFKAMQQMMKDRSGERGQFRYSPSASEFLSVPGLLKWLQEKVGEEFGVMPGLEMAAAARSASKYKLKMALIDRPINITINRLLNNMKFKEKVKLVGYLMATASVFALKPVFGKRSYSIMSMFGESKELDIGKLEKGQGVDELVEVLKQEFPTIYTTLVEERNEFMCKNIAHILKQVDTLVVVVGMGHSAGMKSILKEKGFDVVLV
jgi:pheromone shutdown protein TraB